MQKHLPIYLADPCEPTARCSTTLPTRPRTPTAASNSTSIIPGHQSICGAGWSSWTTLTHLVTQSRSINASGMEETAPPPAIISKIGGQGRPTNGKTPGMATLVTYGLSTPTPLAMTTGGLLPLRLPRSGAGTASTSGRWSSTKDQMITDKVTLTHPPSMDLLARKSHAVKSNPTLSPGHKTRQSERLSQLILILSLKSSVVTVTVDTSKMTSQIKWKMSLVKPRKRSRPRSS